MEIQKQIILYLLLPSIGDDGCIYVRQRDAALYAINPDGTFRWGVRTGKGNRVISCHR